MANTGTSRLNIYLQERRQETSLSWEESRTGTGNERMWKMVCKINGVPRGEATAAQKHVAKNEAADLAWIYLTQNT
ncbi:hypothetical protein BDN70DRAFT_869884 [Pholiota conissans]|uniref:DRBM domain-containing protein n=1 Tax=Pholiota conissans TaxID=109636 RepID=A0A9P5ZH83_9AGAR|nr:hypothetical protein BDN70DRAFT_869884 [Pholiota conissans]